MILSNKIFYSKENMVFAYVIVMVLSKLCNVSAKTLLKTTDYHHAKLIYFFEINKLYFIKQIKKYLSPRHLVFYVSS